MDVTRRLFLGGAITLIAAQTFVPSVMAQRNLPQLWGDGKPEHDDTSGLGALFRREPVYFGTDNIGVDDHEGIIFHRGRWRITQTITVPDNIEIKVEQATIDVLDLDETLYALRGGKKAIVPFTGLSTKWVSWGERRRFLDIVDTFDWTDELVA